MSRETLEHLHTNTLIGNTDSRGTAWHYRAEDQGGESNHYPGPIPVADVQRRLFHWQGVSRRVAVEVPADLATMTHLDDAGEPMRWSVIEDRQAICRSDTHTTMGIFAPSYTMHQYREWLLTTVADILDDVLSTSSAGLLRGGAVAWVEISVPDSITAAEARDALGANALVRTVEKVPTKLLVTDAAVAMAPLSVRGYDAAAVVIRAPSLVQSLVSLFESVWRAGVPIVLDAENAPVEGHAAGPDALDAALLSLMLSGLRDEAVGKQLRMSGRTVQRRLKALMDLTGATSRMQLGWEASERGWVTRRQQR